MGENFGFLSELTKGRWVAAHTAPNAGFIMVSWIAFYAPPWVVIVIAAVLVLLGALLLLLQSAEL